MKGYVVTVYKTIKMKLF